MCFGCGLGCCFMLIEVLFYLSLVLNPLIGSFYGSDVIYRISIYLLIHTVSLEAISTLVPILNFIVPFLNVTLLIGIIFLPISLTPWPVIWFYSKFILFSEPCFKVTESIVLLNAVMRNSQSAADEIEDDEDNAYFYKVLFLLFSSVCYGLSAALAYEIYGIGTYSQLICLFIVLCFCLAAHNMMIMAHEGIISDCAFTCLLNIALLYVMVKEVEQTSSGLTEPSTWKGTLNYSVVTILTKILLMDSNSAYKAIQYFKRFFSTIFIVGLLVRLYSILFIVKKITKNFFQEKVEDDDSCEVDIADFTPPWKSPFLLKVFVIFMFTQHSATYITDWSKETGKLFNDLTQMWPTGLIFSRLLQMIIINIFYIWRLYKAEDWTWNTWLTPEL